MVLQAGLLDFTAADQVPVIKIVLYATTAAGDIVPVLVDADGKLVTV